MKLLNLLTISFLLGLSIESSMAQHPCKEIRATVEVRNTAQQNDGTVTVAIEGNSNQFRVFLIAPKKEENRLDLPVGEIKNLSAGDYELVITESREGDFCPKRIKVAIK